MYQKLRLLKGVVSYSNPAKSGTSPHPSAYLQKHGAVSPEVARKMAEGARKLSDRLRPVHHRRGGTHRRDEEDARRACFHGVFRWKTKPGQERKIQRDPTPHQAASQREMPGVSA
jgi:hypothetical protein